MYGERIGQGLADEEWLRDAGERAWVVLMKDAKIRYRPAELQVLIDFGLRAFCLTNANMRGVEMARRLVEHAVHLRRLLGQRAPTVAQVGELPLVLDCALGAG